MSFHYIALLRAVNLAGQNRVAMVDLRGLLGDLGFAGVRTILQSGNLVFDAGRRKPAPLEALLQRETAKHFGIQVEYFVRSAAEWQAIVADNPFPDEAKSDPGHLVVACLKQAAAVKRVAALRAAIRGRETIAERGRELYILYPDGIGRSKLTTALIEKTLGTRCTARNWNTALKLAGLVKPA
ncbi:MAG: DUF1697 domain-containing protein [Pirellulales bacterium]